MDPVSKYSAVFGRNPAVVRAPRGKWAVSACMFPAMKRSFWRSLMSEAHDQTVYVTAGLSDYTMPVGTTVRGAYPANIELIAFCELPIGGGETGTEDVPTAILQLIADYVLDTDTLVGVGHTLDFGERLAPNTEMSAVLFATTDGVDVKRIRRCTRAKDILNVVPITANEVELARAEGLESLLNRFESRGVRPVFDYLRASAV